MVGGNTHVSLQAKRFSQLTRRWRRTSDGKKSTQESLPTSFRLITWNVDFMAPYSKTRLLTAIRHIQHDVLGCGDDEQPEPCCILLQEVAEQAFPALLDHKWLRDFFLMVPTSPNEWPMRSYGNVTLVGRTLPVREANMLVFGKSTMGRGAVMVDICLNKPHVKMGSSGSSNGSDDAGLTQSRTVKVRIANTHLESLPEGAQARPEQLAAIASSLKQDDLHAGIVCGDMNIIRAEDEGIHERAGLLDAWHGEDEASAFTWGYQPPSRFPAGRLDRIFYTSAEGCIVEVPQRIGVGVKTEAGRWASDHYGLATTVHVV